jgi:hypothetical protein
MNRPVKGVTCDPPKRICTDVDQAITSCEQPRKRHDPPRTGEARVLVRRGEMADVGPTHRASATQGEPQGESNEAALAEEHSA